MLLLWLCKRMSLFQEYTNILGRSWVSDWQFTLKLFKKKCTVVATFFILRLLQNEKLKNIYSLQPFSFLGLHTYPYSVLSPEAPSPWKLLLVCHVMLFPLCRAGTLLNMYHVPRINIYLSKFTFLPQRVVSMLNTLISESSLLSIVPGILLDEQPQAEGQRQDYGINLGNIPRANKVKLGKAGNLLLFSRLEGSHKSCAHQNPEAPQRLSQHCV